MIGYKDVAVSYGGSTVAVIFSVFSGVHIENIIAVVVYSALGGTVSLGVKELPVWWKKFKSWYKGRRKKKK